MTFQQEMDCFRRLLNISPVGDRIEFGVLRGASLRLMCCHSARTFGVDSFAGMGEPGEHDIHHGVSQYPKGRLAAEMSEAQSTAPNAILIKGFVPDVLSRVPPGPYAFASLDMDHYLPTLQALEWLWPRMLPGGIIHADDYFPDRDWLAARALNEFIADHPISGEFERRVWWIL